MAMQGNLNVYFGADGTGTNNSSSSFQDWADSDHAGFTPPGTYKINDTVVLNRSKAMECFPGMSLVTGWDDGSGAYNTARTYEQVRFVTDNTDPDFNMFQIEKEQQVWLGGCFDFSNLTSHSGAAFYLPTGWYLDSLGVGVRAGGWGGYIKGISVLGNVDTLRTSTVANPIGSRGIHIHFPTVSEYPTGDTRSHENAFMTMWFFEMQGAGLKRCIQHDPRIQLPNQHWSNTHHYEVRATHCHTAVWDEGAKDTEYHIRHRAGNVFGDLSTAQNTPSINFDYEGNMLIHPQFYDFRDDTDGGYYFNQKTLDLAGSGYVYGLSQDAYNRRIGIVQGPTIRMFNSVQFREGSVLIP